ncbi:hypothetical protein M1432_02745 [Patescibacteria group bacterium]|nr:hypothetical protein [Patescibacteria group bacterium]
MKAAKIIFWALVGLVALLTIFLALEKTGVVRAAGTNISSSPTSSVAWDDASGYWDFYNTQSVIIAGSNLTGYASSSIGAISLDCATSPNGNICGTSNYGVCNGWNATHNTDGTCSNADATGHLSGFAWNDLIGWISFCGGQNTAVCPGNQSYGVTLSSSTVGSGSDFHGYAWNDTDGWISFNCANNNNCAHPYLVNTAWQSTSTYGYLTSSIFDTGKPQGVTLKSVTWEGSAPADTCVGFQVAGSQSTSGPWIFTGPGAASSTNYYGATCSSAPIGGIGCAPADQPICVDSSVFSGYRYYRYQVKLRSNLLQTETPVIQDVILNFSQ